MLKYALTRFLRCCMTLFAVIAVVFALLRLMPIEGYFTNYDKMTPAQIKVAMAEMGLDRPAIVQLFRYYGSLLCGDLGRSVKYRAGARISGILAAKVPLSLAFGGGSVAIGLMAAIPLSRLMVASESTRFKVAARAGNAFIAFMQAVPGSVCHLCIQIYGTELLSRFVHTPMLFDAHAPASWVLPIFSMSLANASGFCLWLRRYMLDERKKDYVLLARSKGIPNSQVTGRHVFRNAVVPFLHYIPNAFLMSMTGSVYIESRYSIPGMGGLLVEAIKRQDNPLVLALVVCYTVLGVAGMFLGDMSMALADPRIRLAS